MSALVRTTPAWKPETLSPSVGPFQLYSQLAFSQNGWRRLKYSFSYIIFLLLSLSIANVFFLLFIIWQMEQDGSLRSSMFVEQIPLQSSVDCLPTELGTIERTNVMLQRFEKASKQQNIWNWLNDDPTLVMVAWQCLAYFRFCIIKRRALSLWGLMIHNPFSLNLAAQLALCLYLING